MRRHVVVLLALLAALAGCGGGGETAGGPSASPEPTPRAYSAVQLKAALPGRDELPPTGRITFRCPGDRDLCPPKPDRDAFAVGGSVDAASPVGAEQITRSATPVDLFAVNVQRHASDAAAQDVVDRVRRDYRQYMGAFDIPDTEAGPGRVTPGRRGKGAQRPESIGAWKGRSFAYAARSGTSARDEGVQVAQVSLVAGRSTVLVFVSLSAAGREPSAARDVADSLVRDYVERLG